MSRAGYADFFPAAPSVLAKKAQAQRIAKEKSRQVRDEFVDRDVSGALSAESTTSTVSNHSLATVNLTPSTSNSSPPIQMSPGIANKHDVPISSSSNQHDAPAPAPALLTPKATPPAAPAPPAKRDFKIMYDPMLEKDKALQKNKAVYRYDGEGITIPIEDPRKAIAEYSNGPKTGKKQLRTVLGRARFVWDENYIGPGPPSQIMITGLSPLTTEAEVAMNFRTFGEIQSIEMKVDPATGGSLGLCSITYRDSKSQRSLGHQAAKSAVQKGNGLNIAMAKIKVDLDRDGLKCAKIYGRILESKRRKAEEARRKAEEEAAKSRPVPTAPKSLGNGRTPNGISPTRREQSPIRDHDSRFSKPRPPNYVALDELGRRPAVFISSEYIPGESRFCRHLFGRLRNFGLDEVLFDKKGFYVVFKDKIGLQRCYRMCDGDPLFNFRMKMKPLPRGNPRAKSPTPEEPPKPKERIDPIKEASSNLLKDLRTAFISDVRRRIADSRIYDMLEPERLAKRRKVEAEDEAPAAVKDEFGIPSPIVSDAPSVAQKQAPASYPSLSTLRFKKRIRRHETPASEGSPMHNGRRKGSRKDVRPLAHRLNHYDMDGSDDESSVDHRPGSHGSASRAMSIDGGDDEFITPPLDSRERKRKRHVDSRTPSRLKDAMSDDEDDITQSPEDDDNADSEMADFIADSDEEEVNHARKKPKKSKSKRAKEVIFTPDASEDEAEGTKEEEEDEDEVIDIIGGTEETVDISGTARRGSLMNDKDAVAALLTPMDIDDDELKDIAQEERVPIDLSWTQSTTDRPRATVEDDYDIILDLDGLQDLTKDDEDFQFLKKALERVSRANIGNPFAFACRLKEIKAANREGQHGVVRAPERIEPFYRPSSTGSVRTDGYRRIPEAEKSMYLPHRLAVAAKRANLAQPAASSNSTPSTNKPVSSSRMNRVNNRRLVAELNNQKQILNSDADVMRFNQLKKRKKPVKFARSAIHNWGLYAMENISANDMIIEYVGEIVRQQVADLRERKYLKSGIGSSYLFRIDENTVIDATKRGGIARFINHSCTPNCTAKIIKVEGSKRIVIYALRDISENEELTYDYKFERELDSEERIPCLCGSSGCKGFLN